MEPTQITARLVTMEQATHRHGWDLPPTLHFLYRVGTLQVPGAVPNPPGERLRRLAAALAENDDAMTRGLLTATVKREPVAVVFVCETWTTDQFTSEEERQRDTRRLADIPGSREARLVSAVDLDGGHHLVMRVRGEKPKTDYWPAGADGCPEGLVYESLARIAAVLRDTRDGTRP